MGEIADALRRARNENQRRDPRRPPPPPPPQDPLRPSAPEPRRPANESLGAPDGAPPAERCVEELAPRDPAIVAPDGANVEACRQTALRLRAELERSGVRSVAVVSAVRDEGKTTVLCDLGLALASLSDQRDVALVDLDLRNPSVARVLGLTPQRGVEAVLAGDVGLEEVRFSVENPALDLYPAVEPQRSAHERLVLGSFAELVRNLEQRYAVVLVDTPPVLMVPDTSLILRHVGACVAVARHGQSRARYFRQMLDTLPREQVLGVLLNGARSTLTGYYYGYGSKPPPRTLGDRIRSLGMR